MTIQNTGKFGMLLDEIEKAKRELMACKLPAPLPLDQIEDADLKSLLVSLYTMEHPHATIQRNHRLLALVINAAFRTGQATFISSERLLGALVPQDPNMKTARSKQKSSLSGAEFKQFLGFALAKGWLVKVYAPKNGSGEGAVFTLAKPELVAHFEERFGKQQREDQYARVCKYASKADVATGTEGGAPNNSQEASRTDSHNTPNSPNPSVPTNPSLPSGTINDLQASNTSNSHHMAAPHDSEQRVEDESLLEDALKQIEDEEEIKGLLQSGQLSLEVLEWLAREIEAQLLQYMEISDQTPEAEMAAKGRVYLATVELAYGDECPTFPSAVRKLTIAYGLKYHAFCETVRNWHRRRPPQGMRGVAIEATRLIPAYGVFPFQTFVAFARAHLTEIASHKSPTAASELQGTAKSYEELLKDEAEPLLRQFWAKYRFRLGKTVDLSAFET